MATVIEKLMTAEAFYDWANDPKNRDRHFELEEGEVVEVSRPGEKHCVVCGNASGILWNYTRQRKKGYICTNDVGLILERDPDTVRGPDIAVYLESRKFKDLEEKWPKRLPKLIVEVLSEGKELLPLRSVEVWNSAGEDGVELREGIGDRSC